MLPHLDPNIKKQGPEHLSHTVMLARKAAKMLQPWTDDFFIHPTWYSNNPAWEEAAEAVDPDAVVAVEEATEILLEPQEGESQY